MSEIVGFVGMSHSPFATLLPFEGGPGGRFLGDAARVAAAVARLAPDAVVVIGPDHFHANFYDQMPPFVLGVEKATGFGDFGSFEGELPVAAPLAWAVRDGLDEAGFDVSLSYALTVDHGVVQSYGMTTGFSVPLVPLVLNTAAPPLPSLARCVALGKALGDAVRHSSFAGRVLIVASGGLSHWDRWFLRQLYSRDLDPIVALGHDKLEDEAGSGGHEIRTWLVGHAAAGLPLVWDSYEPVPEWITGMGIGTTFAV